MELKATDVPIIHIFRQKKSVQTPQFLRMLEVIQPILQTKGSLRWAVLFIVALYASHVSNLHLLKMTYADISYLEKYLVDFTDSSEVMIVVQNLLAVPENCELLIANGLVEKILDFSHLSDDKIRQSTLTSVLTLLLDKKAMQSN